jgi:hypothetical protein
VGLRAGLDTEDRGKILCPCRGSNPDRPDVQPVVRHYTAYPAHTLETSRGIKVMMEAVRTSETSVDNHFTRQYNPEDSSEHHTYCLIVVYIDGEEIYY